MGYDVGVYMTSVIEMSFAPLELTISMKAEMKVTVVWVIGVAVLRVVGVAEY